MKLVVFDFDGVILETEEPELRTWQEIYADYGETLPVECWAECVGSSSERFDPYADLERRVGRPLDRPALRRRRQRRHAELIGESGPLPGVVGYLEAAAELGIEVSVASSSPVDWVAGHLERLGLRSHFRRLHCREDVRAVKPEPDLYLAAARAAGAAPGQALAIEDSPNGVRAAKRAGLYCVAVPNAVTRGLALDGADLVLPSLEALPLGELLARARSAGPP